MIRIAFKSILLVTGIALLLWSVKPLILLAFGNTANGVITEVYTSNVTTEMQGGRNTFNKPTGFFKVGEEVEYRFDVLPTPVEELKRLSSAPLATDITGSDTLYGKTRFPDIAMHKKGDPLRVIFLKPLPCFNAAYQPRSMQTLGILRLIGGIFIFIWGCLLSSKPKQKIDNTKE